MTQEPRNSNNQDVRSVESSNTSEHHITPDEAAETLTWWRTDVRTFIMNIWVFFAFIIYLAWDYIKNSFKNYIKNSFKNNAENDYWNILRQLPEYLLNHVGHNPVMLYGYGAAAVLIFGGSILSWAFTRYSVSAHSVYRHSGIFFKKQRQIRLESVQSVDISRSLVARILGLSELRLEAADGAEEALHIKYLSHAKAQNLQERLLRRVSTLRAANRSEFADAVSAPAEKDHEVNLAGEQQTEAGHKPERLLFKVPNLRVLAAIVLSALLWALPVAIIWVGGTIVGWLMNPQKDLGQISQFIFPSLIPILGFLWQLWSSFDQGANFTVERIRQNTSDARGDSLRITYGFTGTHTQTLFPQRIQALKIEQPLLWKPFGWYRVVVNIAGVAVNTEGSSDDLFTRNTALPVGTTREMQRLLHLLLPSASPHSLETVQAVMESSRYSPADNSELGVVTAPRRTRWLNPLTFRRDGFARVNTEHAKAEADLHHSEHAPTRDLLLLRGGCLLRFLSIVPERQVLAVQWSQGPLNRILKTACISLGSVPGPVKPTVQNLEVHDAERIAAEIIARTDGTRAYYTSPSA